MQVSAHCDPISSCPQPQQPNRGGPHSWPPHSYLGVAGAAAGALHQNLVLASISPLVLLDSSAPLLVSLTRLQASTHSAVCLTLGCTALQHSLCSTHAGVRALGRLVLYVPAALAGVTTATTAGSQALAFIRSHGSETLNPEPLCPALKHHGRRHQALHLNFTLSPLTHQLPGTSEAAMPLKMYPLLAYFFMSASVTGMGWVTAAAVLVVATEGAPAIQHSRSSRNALHGVLGCCLQHQPPTSQDMRLSHVWHRCIRSDDDRGITAPPTHLIPIMGISRCQQPTGVPSEARYLQSAGLYMCRTDLQRPPLSPGTGCLPPR